MKKITKKLYHGPALALKNKHRKERFIRRGLVVIIPSLLITSTTFTFNKFSPKATVEQDNTAIIETATKLKDSGVNAETSENVLKDMFKGYYVESNGNELTIGLYKNNGNIVPIEKIIFKN